MNDIIPPNTTQKQCCRCKEFFPATFEYFSKYKRSKDGLRFACKKCINLRNVELRQANIEERRAYEIAYREANRESIRENNRRYQRKLPKGHRNAYHRQWQRLNRRRMYLRRRQDPLYREMDRQKSKRFRTKHHETFLACLKKWRLSHPEACYVHSRKRRANKLGATGSHTFEDVQAMLKRQKYRCYYCKQKIQKSKGKHIFHVDHIVPLSRGGSNGPDNLVIACPTCNLKKHDKLPHEWPEGGRLL